MTNAPAYALFIAIDWADDHHDVCGRDPVTQQRTPHTIPHDPTTLHAWLADLHRQYPGGRMAVALEQHTGSLLNLLMEDAHLDLYPVNPAMVATYRKAFHPSGTKTEPTDAEPLTTDAAIIQPAVLEAIMVAQLVLQVGDRIATYDRTIADLFPQHPDAPMLTSLPGAGAVFAPRLLAACGADRARFDSAAQVQNTVGISPVTNASGTMRVVHWRPACSTFLRQRVQEDANESIRHSIWARADYQMHRDRGKRHQAAIRALAFKWIRVICACWQTHQPYDELRDIKALPQRHAPLLEYLSKSDQVFAPPLVSHEEQEGGDEMS